MGILTGWLEKQVNKQLAALKAANPFSGSFSVIGGYAIYPDSNLDALIEDSFNTNIHYYSIIKAITRKAASLPRFVYKGNKRSGEAITNELSALLENPNSSQGADEFWEGVIGFYVSAGETFIWKNRGGLETGKPLELYCLPPQNVELIPDPEDVYGILGYVLNLNGQRIPLAKEDVIHWKTWNPNFDATTREHLRGFSPLKPQTRTITQSNEAVDAQVAMTQNGGAKGVIYQEELANLSPTQMSQLKDVTDNKLNNKKVKNAVAVMQGKWGYLNLGLSSVDMQLLEADEATLRALCNANGLPPELFQSETTFANKEQAMIFYVTNGLMPMMASLDSKLRTGLVPDFGGGMVVITDFSELPEMAQLNAKLIDAAAKAWWKTPDEKRVMTNDEPLGTPEMKMIWIPSGFMPIDQAATPIEPDLDTETEAAKKNGLDYFK